MCVTIGIYVHMFYEGTAAGREFCKQVIDWFEFTMSPKHAIAEGWFLFQRIKPSQKGSLVSLAKMILITHNTW